MDIYCLSGVDGSGKSTLAHRLSNELSDENDGKNYSAKWLGWKEFRMPPFKQIASLLGGQYSEPEEGKSSNKSRQSTFFRSELYLMVILVDHIMFVYYNYFTSCIKNKNLVCDRYYYDIIVSFSAKTDNTLRHYNKLLYALNLIYPTVDQYIIIDVPPNISLERKSDIPNKGFISDRKKRYKIISRMYDIPIVDNSGEINEAANKIKEIVNDDRT